MVGRAGSTTGTVHADITLTRSKVKVTGFLNFRKLAKPCMHAGGDDRQPPSGVFITEQKSQINTQQQTTYAIHVSMSIHLLSVIYLSTGLT